MYPRNAASPERFDIGPVVQILDGVVQTSGVSVSVLPMGGVSGAAAGTIAYENGIVVYTPTQAETNYTSVVFVAYKTGCIPASKTVVFSASGTAGYAGTDQSKIANPTATVALTNTTTADSPGVTEALTRLPDATAGAAGGLLIAGSNAATTFATLTVSGLTTLTGAVALTDITTAGSLGKYLADILGYADCLPASWVVPLTSQQVRDAMKLAPTAGTPDAGSVDVHLDDILEDTGTTGVVVAAASKTGYTLSAAGIAAIFDVTDGIESGVTPRQAMRAIGAALAGILSGAGTAIVTIKAVGAAAGGTTRITATVDADGNRSAITLNL